MVGALCPSLAWTWRGESSSLREPESSKLVAIFGFVIHSNSTLEPSIAGQCGLVPEVRIFLYTPTRMSIALSFNKLKHSMQTAVLPMRQ